MDAELVIQEWLKSKRAGSLLLPDGWFGRPYDNQHILTFIREVDEVLILVLDDRVTLRFEGLKSVKENGPNLVLGSFDKCCLMLERGDAKGIEIKEYGAGEIRIMSTPG
jgi:hypothetical protein